MKNKKIYGIDHFTVREWMYIEKILSSVRIKGLRYDSLGKGMYVDEIYDLLRKVSDELRKNIIWYENVLSYHKRTSSASNNYKDIFGNKTDRKEYEDSVKKYIKFNQDNDFYIHKMIQKCKEGM